MKAIHTIVVAMDSSPCSADALMQAVRLADLAGANVRAIHAVDQAVLEDLQEASNEPADRLKAQIVDAARSDISHAIESQNLDSGNVAVAVTVGDSVEDIAGYTREHHADLLVVGRTGAGQKRRGIGKQALAISRRVECSTLVVPEGWRQPFRRMAVGVDFSDQSLHAAATAIQIGRLEQAAIELVHVFLAPWHRLHYRTPTIEVAADFQREYRAKLEARLNDFAITAAERQPTIKVLPRLVADYSDAGYGLLQYAADGKVDLLVCGTHGRSGLRRLLMGSTAEEVLQGAQCAVLVAKSSAESDTAQSGS